MSNSTPITAGPTEQGVRLTIEGRGTLVESQTVRELVDRALADPGARAIIDLDRCTYLDSTFLGMLVGHDRLKRLFGVHCADKGDARRTARMVDCFLRAYAP